MGLKTAGQPSRVMGRPQERWTGSESSKTKTLAVVLTLTLVNTVGSTQALALCHYLDTHHQQLSLPDKAVLEIAAGTGLVSIVASLLGAWATAIDLPETMNNLRFNLSRNTRGHCKYLPQVAVLSWDLDLKQTYPSSIYRYDYVLVASAAYHQEHFKEFLSAMRHFCRPGTTLIFAIKVRMELELRCVEDLKKTFHTTLLSDDGSVQIFKATCREDELDEDEEVDRTVLQCEKERHIVNEDNKTGNVTVLLKPEMLEAKTRNKENEEEEVEEEGDTGETVDCTEDGDEATTSGPSHTSTTTSDKDSTGESLSFLLMLLCYR
ncbi:protein-lysine methyltransferase METTL21E-like [Cynoglossus semilaevis]|uniref:protein-lysine methyltransferase METTL21E-like n=1 Tax=Cynoglossus semilaevis TaxID=244447 RepID=UPI000D627F63|nr:protein-lysine methyltransferase METTL21E-like [Cynoglossus semilaevis]